VGVGGGIAITRIKPDSPAARGDIREHDVVTAVDGVAVSDMVSLLVMVRDKGVGATITLTVVRPGAAGAAMLYPEATLVDRPADRPGG
jgi:S1-C subfamily serine protease